MKWLIPIGAIAIGAVIASRPSTREQVAGFRDEVRNGMGEREAQLREVLAMDTHLTLPGEKVDEARAIEGH
ncbi:hypothetical protein [Flexivirga sp. B27]